MLRLVDKKATKTIIIEDTAITIRQLTAAEMMTLADNSSVQPDGGIAFDRSTLIPLIAKGIVSIEGHEGTPALEVLESIESAQTLSKIVSEVFEYSRLSEQQAKNSSASPVSGSGDSAGKGASNASGKTA